MFFLTSSSQTSIWSSVLMMAVGLVVFYFMLIRPQNKKEKAQQKMRSEMQIGDEIVTIGGIVGRVISIKDDTVQIETGSDRTKMRFKKWSVQEVNKLDAALNSDDKDKKDKK